MRVGRMCKAAGAISDQRECIDVRTFKSVINEDRSSRVDRRGFVRIIDPHKFSDAVGSEEL